ncbi:MAG: 16S rRNA (guanine(966)-N(2))-methyltransferase RsmD [Ruminococcaceae bacterium]|nr:16S rRNA (guanine(966)-N(2))-methyltransferase RsmD [Oscillospiraceae bacterium]
MMRIISGTAKGIRLKTLDGDATRPTAERVKEAVFSMLQGDIEEREVLDLFSGSGQMGLEAISRGAASAVLVDKSTDAIKIIKENAAKTKLHEKCDIRKDEYLSYLKKSTGKKFDLIFIDPPYASGFYQLALQALLNGGFLKQSTLIVCESGEENIFDKNQALQEEFKTIKRSRYGRTFITILMPEMGE